MLLNVRQRWDDSRFALVLHYFTSCDLSLKQKVILFNYMVGEQIAS